MRGNIPRPTLKPVVPRIWPTATARASSRQWGAKSPEKAGTNVSPPVS